MTVDFDVDAFWAAVSRLICELEVMAPPPQTAEAELLENLIIATESYQERT